MSTPPVLKQEAHEAIRQAGYVVNVVPDISEVPQWTGAEFNFSQRSPGTWDMHEVFHLAVANPAQRKRPDFGLGRHVDAEYAPRPFADRNAAWGDEFVIAHSGATRFEVLACDLFPVFGLIFPGHLTDAKRAALDFGCLDWAKFNRPDRGVRAVALGYDVLSKFLDMPMPKMQKFVSDTWNKWYGS